MRTNCTPVDVLNPENTTCGLFVEEVPCVLHYADVASSCYVTREVVMSCKTRGHVRIRSFENFSYVESNFKRNRETLWGVHI